ncbi:MAG: pyruvate dehydrogenase (acetyl-transferring) E1 component subunit alpha [Flavobacteriales bacterium]|jgi:pyruvate dehydrogenase E1 component alpha subunit|nr:pyruvate dehydrogenase (acetyl-transferring) E1 component subunit alpha [Flavobacteriales bacterium]NCG30112.1 pyruvate dehydrogenase (acetyl-transferring) E1 component subunit alpha [Bacteroidota bacterium]MBT3964446.1 pyruvate dehydrogenase (acetyl-transferring) E1 component subunit alpha [Flavobacteriales bacterium]MBT4705109.1 pyruvate dehydrogenase (acetyl-transferring) E1 component subunit alpha [Flavobacteriales bacterium]MBT4930129.1 pyruvate dehydrogenase (acetyl-transferring) E1 co
MAKKSPAKKPAYTKSQYLKWYQDMLLIRRFEESCGNLYLQQKFGGFCHLYIGQEAIAAGFASAMIKGDKIITAYRDHAHPLALGMDPNTVMAELYGKTTGSSKGKGGSMHMFDKDLNMMGGHGIVGAQIPMGAGIAFAEKYNGTKNVCMTFMGDGAVRQGALHETFNMAMLWKLPVVFIIENNNYAMGTSIERTTNVTDLSKLGLSYDLPGESVDGMRVESVHEAIQKAANHCRDGKGPYLLDIRTYRYKGHSMSDPQKYRTKEEVNEYKNQDPISQVLKTIKGQGWLTEKQIENIDSKVKQRVQDSVTFAEESPLATEDELFKDVYMQEDYPYITN